MLNRTPRNSDLYQPSPSAGPAVAIIRPVTVRQAVPTDPVKGIRSVPAFFPGQNERSASYCTATDCSSN